MNSTAQALARRLMEVAREMKANGVEESRVVEHVLGLLFEGMQERDEQIAALEVKTAEQIWGGSREDLVQWAHFFRSESLMAVIAELELTHGE